MACAPAFGDPPQDTPTGSFLSSLKQAFNKDFDHEVVRGHFDVGTPPDAHRFYCLVDAKTGRSETNGVAGQPFVRPDGMTGVKSPAVSFYSCANAEQRGTLDVSGYVLSGAAGSAATAQKRPAEVSPPQVRPSQDVSTPEKNPPATRAPYDSLDVAGLRLGMSPDEVRAVLKSKKLVDYHESARSLYDESVTAVQMPAAGLFVNTIAAWTLAVPPGDGAAAYREAYEVMFTPVPGQERAMSIAHTLSYSNENALKQSALENGLVKKYGGYPGPELPDSPTWRLQRGGEVLVGDSCNRRAVAGGIRDLGAGAARQNLALKTTPEEFQYQIEHCGVAIVSEDHATANAGAARQDRTVARFTVTAYSPSVGLDGAMAAMQLTRAAGNAAERSKASRSKDQPAPIL